MEPARDLDDLRQRLLAEHDRRHGIPDSVTRREAAAILRVSLSTIDRWRASGALRSAKIRGVVRIDVADIRALFR